MKGNARPDNMFHLYWVPLTILEHSCFICKMKTIIVTTTIIIM